jgi:hypothetical protein
LHLIYVAIRRSFIVVVIVCGDDSRWSRWSLSAPNRVPLSRIRRSCLQVRSDSSSFSSSENCWNASAIGCWPYDTTENSCNSLKCEKVRSSFTKMCKRQKLLIHHYQSSVTTKTAVRYVAYHNRCDAGTFGGKRQQELQLRLGFT